MAQQSDGGGATPKPSNNNQAWFRTPGYNTPPKDKPKFKPPTWGGSAFQASEPMAGVPDSGGNVPYWQQAANNPWSQPKPKPKVNLNQPPSFMNAQPQWVQNMNASQTVQGAIPTVYGPPAPAPVVAGQPINLNQPPSFMNAQPQWVQNMNASQTPQGAIKPPTVYGPPAPAPTYTPSQGGGDVPVGYGAGYPGVTSGEAGAAPYTYFMNTPMGVFPTPAPTYTPSQTATGGAGSASPFASQYKGWKKGGGGGGNWGQNEYMPNWAMNLTNWNTE